MEPASTPRPLVQKKTLRDSLPIDMLLSAVYILVVAQSSSEFPEGLMNNPVHTASTCSFRAKAESRKKIFVRVSEHCRFYTKKCTINVNIILRGQGINLLRFRSNHISLNFFVFRNFDTVTDSPKYCQSTRVLSFCRTYASNKAQSGLKNRISYDSVFWNVALGQIVKSYGRSLRQPSDFRLP